MAALALVACTEEAASDRAPTSGDSEDAASAEPDPKVGRDTTAQSCFAACQNASLSCADGVSGAPRDAFVEITASGCSGEIAQAGKRGVPAPLEIDCMKHQACVGEKCEDAAFNATSLTWGKTVCVRVIP